MYPDECTRDSSATVAIRGSISVKSSCALVAKSMNKSLALMNRRPWVGCEGSKIQLAYCCECTRYVVFAVFSLVDC
jgi:hypothetical protein